MKPIVGAVLTTILVAIILALAVAIDRNFTRKPWLLMCPRPDITSYELARMLTEDRYLLASEQPISRHLCKEGGK